jgi:hypothetical protein
MFYLYVKCKAHSDQTETCRIRLMYTKGAHNSHKSRSQKRDKEQVPYRRPTHIKRRRTKFIVARATWPPGFMHLWCKSPASFSSRGKAARKGGHLPSDWHSERRGPYLSSWCQFHLYVIGLNRRDKDCFDRARWHIEKVWKYIRCLMPHECFRLAWHQLVVEINNYTSTILACTRPDSKCFLSYLLHRCATSPHACTKTGPYRIQTPIYDTSPYLSWHAELRSSISYRHRTVL